MIDDHPPYLFWGGNGCQNFRQENPTVERNRKIYYKRNDLQTDVLLFSDYLFENFHIESCKLLLYCLLQVRDLL